jgi:hypothetical protein
MCAGETLLGLDVPEAFLGDSEAKFFRTMNHFIEEK